ncbi:MAG TPA: Hsp70 family protein [Pseudonocardiaceae bacterium]|jgi:molecular chaperone DnaK (HSP70)|nr:Hsp70 family protein [Pseudonocardiaceae bacterium]
MPYVLGIDVGTSHTSAAVCRLGGPAAGSVRTARLGSRSNPGSNPGSNAVASTLYLPGDGSVVVGDIDPRLALTEPQRLARGFSRRVGDDVPFVVDGVAYSAEELTAALIVWVTDQLAEREGGPAEHVVVTHPASWGPHRRGVLRAALRQVELAEVTLLPEPIAVGESHAWRTVVDPGDVLAVCGLGGDWCYGAVVRRTDNGAFVLLGQAEDGEPGGGERIDDAVLDWLAAELADPLGQLDPADPQTALIMARLRQECRAAKERLSDTAETTVDVRLPHGVYQPALTRPALDALARPILAGSVGTLLRAVRASGMDAERLAAVTLAGGPARMPVLRELVTAAMPGRIAVDEDPQATVATGAALAGYRRMTGADVPAASRPAGALVLAGGPPNGRGTGEGRDSRDGRHVVPAARDGSVQFPTEVLQRVAAEEDDLPPPRPSVDIDPLDLPRRRNLGTLIPGARPAVMGGLAVLLAAAIVTVTFIFQSGTSNRGSSLTGGTVQGGSSAATQTVQATQQPETAVTDTNSTANPGTTDHN